MSTILLTGANGIIGSILRESLALEHSVRGLDLPDDLTSNGMLIDMMREAETVIHLARERNAPGAQHLMGRINPTNVRIDFNVFAAVVEARVKRLVFASSVHADDFRNRYIEIPLKAPGSYYPATPYGSYKLIGEEVGKIFAARFGLEFIAMRFGGVTADNSVKEGVGRAATWLSHRDLQGAMTACLANDPVPGRCAVFYVVSNNARRIHDTSNPFGWEPKDDSSKG